MNNPFGTKDNSFVCNKGFVGVSSFQSLPEFSALLLINSREAIAEAIIGLLLVFYLFRRQDFCYDHMTSQPLQFWFLLIRSCNFN